MGHHVLVVDDEPDVVELIGINLRARGYQVTVAYDGMSAVLKAQQTRPDLVILDVMMEGMDGLSACEILRAQPATRAIPVIILTAATGEMARVSGFGAGAADFVSKPFSPGDLCRRVARLLEKGAAPGASADA